MLATYPTAATTPTGLMLLSKPTAKLVTKFSKSANPKSKSKISKEPWALGLGFEAGPSDPDQILSALYRAWGEGAFACSRISGFAAQ